MEIKPTKFYAKDGKHFLTEKEATAYDERQALLKQVAAISNGTPEVILSWFEANFRVPPKPAQEPKWVDPQVRVKRPTYEKE